MTVLTIGLNDVSMPISVVDSFTGVVPSEAVFIVFSLHFPSPIFREGICGLRRFYASV